MRKYAITSRIYVYFLYAWWRQDVETLIRPQYGNINVVLFAVCPDKILNIIV